jgi:predicted transcriptional regulator
MKREILKLFRKNKQLPFTKIEENLKTRSNKLAYHLKQLQEENIVEKQNQSYKLKEEAEELIPYLYEEKSPLP